MDDVASEPVTLLLESENLLALLYECWQQLPSAERRPFQVPLAGNRVLTITHPNLPGGSIGASWVYVNQLQKGGFIQLAAPKASQQEALRPRFFIVHGHDERTRLEVKNYLQNTLRFPEPIILHEVPSRGRTIIEKFEGTAAAADGAIVILTEEDRYVETGTDEELRHARQNVVFELGYFLALFGRKSGKVLLLHKGPVQLPSDINGVVYINISLGVVAAGEQIRNELGLR